MPPPLRASANARASPASSPIGIGARQIAARPLNDRVRCSRSTRSRPHATACGAGCSAVERTFAPSMACPHDRNAATRSALSANSGSGNRPPAGWCSASKPPDARQRRFDGRPCRRPDTPAWRAQRARMQMIFQDPLGALDRRMPMCRADRASRSISTLSATTHSTRGARRGVAAQRSGFRPTQALRYPHELSGGQRQRVVLARALATEARLPGLRRAGQRARRLDPGAGGQSAGRSAGASSALAMLFISHDLRVVRQISERVAVMYLGAHRRAWATPTICSRAAASLYPGAGLGIAGARAAQRRTHRACTATRRTRRRAERLRLPSALPASRSRAAAPRRRRSSTSRPDGAASPAICAEPHVASRSASPDAALFRHPHLLRALFTIALVVTFAFVVLRLSGDPALIIMGPEAPPEVIAAFRKAWGLDDPLWMQYFDYFGAIATGRTRPLDARRARRHRAGRSSASRQRWR